MGAFREDCRQSYGVAVDSGIGVPTQAFSSVALGAFREDFHQSYGATVDLGIGVPTQAFNFFEVSSDGPSPSSKLSARTPTGVDDYVDIQPGRKRTANGRDYYGPAQAWLGRPDHGVWLVAGR
jgi:hypothetical protein